MLARSWSLLLCAPLLGCPQVEPESDCRTFDCGADAYCDGTTLQCRTDVLLADSQLEQCVRDEIGLAEGTILVSDANAVVSLECPDRQIVSLEGLQHFVNLESLALWENEIADLTPLKPLTKLIALQLGNNAIQDIWPIEPLVGLRRLGLAYNAIEDIGVSANLWDLEWLNLDQNNIADVTPLWDLTKLVWLTIENNPIADLTPIEDLQNHGTDTYKQRAADSGGGRLARELLAAVPAHERFDQSKLTYVVDGKGSLQLRVRGRDRVYPVRHEYDGQLHLSGQSVVYSSQGRDFAVGAVLGLTIELCRDSFSAACQLAIGVKWPEANEASAHASATEPIYSANLLLRGADGRLGGGVVYKGDPSTNQVLDPFALASPNQLDAGSCVFMANTGAMEILMNQRVPAEARTYQGDTDLSERYLMNVIDYVDVRSSITDLVDCYRDSPGALLDRDYGFILGHGSYDANGNWSPNTTGDLSAQANWINGLPANWRDLLVPTPGADRTMLYRSPRGDNGIWDVGLMNDDIIERIKFEIRTKHAPVIVVYNHYNYWHSVIIIGYDDNVSVGNCPFVMDSVSYFAGDGDNAPAATKIRNQIAAAGGCSTSGVFYVRDSIYDGGTDLPMYNYGSGYSDRYSKRVIMHEYDWVKYLANHAYTFHRN